MSCAEAYSAAFATALSGAGKLRSWRSAGIAERASSTLAGSISAVIQPTFSPPSASTSPHGFTIRLWPQVRRPSAWVPPWLAAKTKLPVSMARARTRISQWALPVV